MNEKAHWNRIGSGYDDEIFDVFQSDRKQLLAQYFAKHANKQHIAIDFGCGTGKAFKYLSPAFKQVTGFDISKELLKVAKSRRFENIILKQADLTLKNIRFEPSDFLFCCNVIMLPKAKMNRAMFRNVYQALKPGGHAVLVVPSLESMFFTAWRLIEWNRKEGIKPDEIPASDLAYFSASKRQIAEGIIHIDKVPTKHYTEPELRVVLAEADLTVTATERVEYDWTTEFPEPPSWMKEPYPWDWLVEVRR
ncbi:MAG: class I SAM-dependent methyltransferase [Cyclobacteriaceae bacterium]|nr:class I SAM-dependent methyltransferase [Cyclobacteriaceae bacterium]